MAQKWTEEQKSKFKETMKGIYAKKRAQKEESAKKLAERKARYRAKTKKDKHQIKVKTIYYKRNGGEQRKTDVAPQDLPVIEIRNGNTRDVQEFAAFMAEAWRVYKGL